jgi:hypothetical protein
MKWPDMWPTCPLNLLSGDPEALDEDGEPYTADTAGLRGFLEGEIVPGSPPAGRNWRTGR